MADRTHIKSAAEAADYVVTIHGVPIADVMSADAAKGEVWVHLPGQPKLAKELKTGTVSIQPKPKTAKGS